MEICHAQRDKKANASQTQSQKVGKRNNGEGGLFFTPKNTKSPPKSRTLEYLVKYSA